MACRERERMLFKVHFAARCHLEGVEVHLNQHQHDKKRYHPSIIWIPESSPVAFIRFRLQTNRILAHTRPRTSRVHTRPRALLKMDSTHSSELILGHHWSSSNQNANIVESQSSLPLKCHTGHSVERSSIGITIQLCHRVISRANHLSLSGASTRVSHRQQFSRLEPCTELPDARWHHRAAALLGNLQMGARICPSQVRSPSLARTSNRRPALPLPMNENNRK